MLELLAVLAAWLFTYLVHSTLLLGGAWLAERLRLVRTPAVREFVWRVALVGGVLTATLQSGLGSLGEGRPAFLPHPAAVTLGLNAVAVPSAAPAPTASQLEAARTQPAPRSPEASRRPVLSRTARLGDGLRTRAPFLLCMAWLLAAAIAAVRLGVLARLAARELAGRERDADSPLHERLLALCAADPHRTPPLSHSPRLSGPVCLPNGEICVPDWVATELSPAQQRALLAHELAHVRRGDPHWQLATLVLETLLVGQPLNAVARLRLAGIAELAADAWAARTIADPRSLAECLAECAERVRPERAALFATAMTGRSPLVERVHRLLEGLYMQTDKIPYGLRVGAAIALGSLALMLPVVVVNAGGGHSEHRSFGHGLDIARNGDHINFKSTRPGYSLEARVDGAVHFNDAESDVASLTPGGTFELTEVEAGTTHRLRLTSRDGKTFERLYWIGARARPFDADGAAWLARVLPVVARSTEPAKVRVERLLARGGVAAVLEDISRIDQDYDRGRYLVALFAARKLSDTEYEQAIGLAAGIGSDYERRQALVAALDQAGGAARQRALLSAAKGMDSDHEAAELLVAAAPRLWPAAEPREAWFALASGVGSDYELGRSYAALLDGAPASAGMVARVLEQAPAHLRSDHELHVVLSRARSRLGEEPSLVGAYLRASARLGSDFERSGAVTELLDEHPLDAAACGQALEVIGTLGSDFERSRALVALAARMPDDPALIQHYRGVARTLGNFERGEAEQALDRFSR